MATELGNAYVQRVPSAQGIKGSIESVIGGEAERAGKSRKAEAWQKEKEPSESREAADKASVSSRASSRIVNSPPLTAHRNST